MANQTPRGHHVLFHRDDSDLTGHIADFLQPIRAGRPAIALATHRHLDALIVHLVRDGVDVKDLRAKGLLLLLDAEDVATAIMDGDSVNAARFDQLVLNTVTETNVRHGKPRIYGELVNVIAARGRPDLSIVVEQLWHGYSRATDFHLLCGYDWNRYLETPDWGAQVTGLHDGVSGDDPRDHLAA